MPYRYSWLSPYPSSYLRFKRLRQDKEEPGLPLNLARLLPQVLKEAQRRQQRQANVAGDAGGVGRSHRMARCRPERRATSAA